MEVHYTYGKAIKVHLRPFPKLVLLPNFTCLYCLPHYRNC